VINFNQTNDFTLSSSISGNGSLNQLGAGTTTLSGSNSFTGGTVISAGTLLANNASGSALGGSAVTVQSGGTLGGNGSIGGAATIASGGNLTTGSGGIGALSLSGGLTLLGGSTTTFLINSTNSFTSINLIGSTFTYGGALSFNITSYTPAAGDAFTVFNMTGGAVQSGDFTSVTAGSLIFTEAGGVWSGMYNGLQYQFSDATGTLSVNPTLVPEPSTYALLGLGALALVVAYRRKIA
jgi:autotransporter-associated beta strand protein